MDDLNNITDTQAFENEEEYRIPPIIKVIGVGGGGCNAVNFLYSQGIDNVTFLVCNTDKQAIRKLKVPTKIILGPEVTSGLGAGDNPMLGKEAAEASADDIRNILNDNTEMVFITAGMGGGTGTGAGPVVAKIAKEAGLLTIGIVTIPFYFEGEKKIYKALEGAEEMRKYVDSLLIINNERLTEIYPDLDLVNAFQKADDTLANATRSIAQIINTEGHINVDFNDVKTTLKDSSTAIISTGYGEGEHRVTKAIQDALNSPLLRNSDISSSKRLLFYLYCNPKAKNVVSMAEMKEITQFSANLSPNIGIKPGLCWDESLGEGVKMTILASGFDLTVMEKASAADNSGHGSGVITFGGSAEKKTPQQYEKAAAKPNTGTALDKMKMEYDLLQHKLDKARSKYVVLKPSQFDDDEVIYKMEKHPTYNRELRIKEELRILGTAEAEHRSDDDTHPDTSSASGEEPADKTAPIVF